MKPHRIPARLGNTDAGSVTEGSHSKSRRGGVEVTRKLAEVSQSPAPRLALSDSMRYEVTQLKFLELTLTQHEVA